MDRYHPDKNANNPEALDHFNEVAYSYSILSDPEKRRQYDSAGFEVSFWLILFCLLLIIIWKFDARDINRYYSFSLINNF